MKVELTIGVYSGGDLVDTVSYVVACEPLARIFSTLPDDPDDIGVDIERLRVVYE